MKPPMPRAITPLSPSYHAPITRGRRRRSTRWGNRPGAVNAYMVRVNDDGYPVEEPAPTDRPRVVRLASRATTRCQAPHAREARIRWHTERVARHE